MKIEDKCTIDE